MIRYVAFLRGINVGGHNLIKMDVLKSHFELPGIANIATYIQSGNVLFDSEETNEGILAATIDKQLTAKLGYKVPIVLRGTKELKSVIKNNPFDDIKPEDTVKLYVTFLSAVPLLAVRGSLAMYATDTEDARLIKREVYICTDNYSKTRLNNTLIEKKLGVTATTRNWATVNKLVEL